MTTYTCKTCKLPIPVGAAVLRGNLHELEAWHRDCWTFHRATWDLEAPATVLGGTLSERLERLREMSS